MTGALTFYFNGGITAYGDVDSSNLYMLFEHKVLGKYDLSVEKTEEIKYWCNDKDVEFLCEIHFDLNVVKATRAVKSVIDMFPDTPASLAIMDIIKKLEEKFQI